MMAEELTVVHVAAAEEEVVASSSSKVDIVAEKEKEKEDLSNGANGRSVKEDTDGDGSYVFVNGNDLVNGDSVDSDLEKNGNGIDGEDRGIDKLEIKGEVKSESDLVKDESCIEIVDQDKESMELCHVEGPVEEQKPGDLVESGPVSAINAEDGVSETSMADRNGVSEPHEDVFDSNGDGLANGIAKHAVLEAAVIDSSAKQSDEVSSVSVSDSNGGSLAKDSIDDNAVDSRSKENEDSDMAVADDDDYGDGLANDVENNVVDSRSKENEDSEMAVADDGDFHADGLANDNVEDNVVDSRSKENEDFEVAVADDGDCYGDGLANDNVEDNVVDSRSKENEDSEVAVADDGDCYGDGLANDSVEDNVVDSRSKENEDSEVVVADDGECNGDGLANDNIEDNVDDCRSKENEDSEVAVADDGDCYGDGLANDSVEDNVVDSRSKENEDSEVIVADDGECNGDGLANDNIEDNVVDCRSKENEDSEVAVADDGECNGDGLANDSVEDNVVNSRSKENEYSEMAVADDGDCNGDGLANDSANGTVSESPVFTRNEQNVPAVSVSDNSLPDASTVSEVSKPEPIESSNRVEEAEADCSGFVSNADGDRPGFSEMSETLYPDIVSGKEWVKCGQNIIDTDEVPVEVPVESGLDLELNSERDLFSEAGGVSISDECVEALQQDVHTRDECVETLQQDVHTRDGISETVLNNDSVDSSQNSQQGQSSEIVESSENENVTIETENENVTVETVVSNTVETVVSDTDKPEQNGFSEPVAMDEVPVERGLDSELNSERDLSSESDTHLEKETGFDECGKYLQQDVHTQDGILETVLLNDSVVPSQNSQQGQYSEIVESVPSPIPNENENVTVETVVSDTDSPEQNGFSEMPVIEHLDIISGNESVKCEQNIIAMNEVLVESGLDLELNSERDLSSKTDTHLEKETGSGFISDECGETLQQDVHTRDGISETVLIKYSVDSCQNSQQGQSSEIVESAPSPISNENENVTVEMVVSDTITDLNIDIGASADVGESSFSSVNLSVESGVSDTTAEALPPSPVDEVKMVKIEIESGPVDDDTKSSCLANDLKSETKISYDFIVSEEAEVSKGFTQCDSIEPVTVGENLSANDSEQTCAVLKGGIQFGSVLTCQDSEPLDEVERKRPFYFLIRVPRYDDENLKEKIRLAQIRVDEKTQSRDAIRIEMQSKRATCKEYGDNFDTAISQERAARDLHRSKRQEIESIQSLMDIRDIDAKIRNLEHMIQHETLPLKDEKQFIREIKQLKQNREKLHSNIGREDEFQQKDQIDERLKSLKKEADQLKVNLLKAEAVTKAAKKKYHDETEKLNKLLSQFKAADDIRQEAYAQLQSLKKQSYEKNKYFWQYRDDSKTANDLALKGDKEALENLCINQVEKLMDLWNNNDEFRKEYLRCNVRSTLRRLRTLDGRALGPDEEPPVIPQVVNERVAKDHTLSSSTLEDRTQEKVAVAKGEKANDKSVAKVVEQKDQTSKSEKLVKSVPPASGSTTDSSRDKIEEAGEEKPKRTKEEEEVARKAAELRKEEEVARKAEELRKEKEAAKSREQRRLEEIAKAKEAVERKRRIAEKAQARAALRAQKEAEQKEKEREKRAKKKERRKVAAAAGDAGVLDEAVSAPTSETPAETPKESETKEKPATVAKRPQKPSQFTKQTKAKSIPPPLRNRGKRRMQPWLWILLISLVIFALLLIGNYNFSFNFGLQRLKF